MSIELQADTLSLMIEQAFRRMEPGKIYDMHMTLKLAHDGKLIVLGDPALVETDSPIPPRPSGVDPDLWRLIHRVEVNPMHLFALQERLSKALWWAMIGFGAASIGLVVVLGAAIIRSLY